jgi:hypothetical protein
MFERGFTALNGDRQKVPVSLKLDNGALVSANILMTSGGRLIELLNKPEPFIEVEWADGTTAAVSKQAIREASALTVSKADQLAKSGAASFDPNKLLGVAPGAPNEEIRAAYLARVKQYHPDRFIGLNLPAEVEQYAESMLQRINAAYQFLCPRELAA